MAGELTIQQNTDGTATINFEGGGSHTVGAAGDNVADNVAALQSAYGDRIGNVIDSPNSDANIATTLENTTNAEVSVANQQLEDGSISYEGQNDRVVNVLDYQGFRELNYDTLPSNFNNTIVVPSWVDSAYEESYISSAISELGGYGTTRAPNTAELAAAMAGINPSENPDYRNDVDFQANQSAAVSLRYGVVGSNTDTRDWDKIMDAGMVVTSMDANGNPVFGFDGDKIQAATSIATNQMYGGITLQYGSTGEDADGNPLTPTVNLVGGNGTLLRTINKGLAPSSIEKIMYGFGIKSGQITNLKTTLGENLFNEFNLGDYQFGTPLNLTSFDNAYKYNFGNSSFVAGLSTPKTKLDTTPEESTKVVEETIKPPQSTAPNTVVTAADIPSTISPVSQSIPATTYTPTSSQLTPQTMSTNTFTPATPATTGTMGTPLQTAGITSVPSTIQVNPNVTGTTMANLTSQSQKGFGGVVKYKNSMTGQEIMISIDAQGNPLTMVPPGYTRVQGQAEGGSVAEDSPDVKLARKFLGFNGPASQLTNFLAANPAAAARMGKYQQAMSGMAQKRVGAQTGVVGTSLEDFQKMQQNLIAQTMQPLPAAVSQITPQAADFVAPTAGQATPVSPMANVATVGTVQQAATPTAMTPRTMTAETAATDVATEAAKLNPQVGTITPGATIDAAQQLTTSVGNVGAAQGAATLINAPDKRQIQEGEIISGVADAEKAATFNEQIQAATATPTKQATVAGQLEGLMAQFEGGNTPAWAAGAMRSATAAMVARGLGASSMAGQAIVQAAMESALPIAQMDASVLAQFEAQNLSNRQQRAILAAQQRAQFLGQEFDQGFQARVQNSARIGDIANLNFTAEQQIALEDSRAVNTMNLNNLSNRQALVMAEAAALSQLDVQNLNNRQQTAVQNAQNFLQMDMTNLANVQQTELFKTQQNIQGLFTDQAAKNAAEQFNATSESQTDQFFASLSNQTSQFNSAQQNAMDQFNINTTNAMRQFNSEVQQQRDLFNAQNGLVIAQANAQWRQNLATVNTAAVNQANMDFAKNISAMSTKNLDEIWQRERDIMSFAFTSDQSAMDRALQVIMGDKELDIAREKLNDIKKTNNTALAMRFLFGTSPSGILGAIGSLNPFN